MTFDELQALNAPWRLAIEQLEEGVLLLRGGMEDLSNLQILYANPAVTRRVGLEPGALDGVPLGLLLMEDQHDRFRRDWLASDPQEVFTGQFALRVREGGFLEADWTITSRTSAADGVPEHTVTLRWPRERTSAGSEGDSAGLNEEASFEVNKADTIAHIARGIVHDFNNSLTAIRGHLEVAMQDTVEGAPVRGALEQAMEAAVTTSDLCRRLLNYAKGRRSAKRACEVKDLLLQAEAITGFGSNVTCEHFVRPGLWPVLADGIQIVQVINNLLVNAQQAMPEGGMIALLAENVAPESHLPQGLPPGDYVAIKVRDRGVGIPEEKQKRIFEALYTTKADGSGLGLATCAQIVSAHQGFIDVHSVPSRGSEFTVYLPAATAAPVNGVDSEEPSAMENADAAVPPSTSVASQLKILVVEDQLGIRKIAQACLEKLGHEVVCAESGEKALALHREAWGSGDRFDLGLIDMTLPGGMNGEDTFRELCNVDPHLIGIATSGSIDAESLPLYQRKGFAAILPKPFPLRLLGEVVEEAMQFHTV